MCGIVGSSACNRPGGKAEREAKKNEGRGFSLCEKGSGPPSSAIDGVALILDGGGRSVEGHEGNLSSRGGGGEK